MAVTEQDIQRVAALRGLPPAQQDLLAGLMVYRHYAPGELIFLEGDQSGGLWFILQGRVRIIKLSTNGRVQALCVANRGTCFGGCPLFSMENNPANAQALDEVVLLVLPQHETAALQAEDPALMAALLKIYSERLQVLARLSESLGTWPVAARINETLVNYAVSESGRLLARFTHEQIASLAGTVREVVTRHMGELESSGIIRQQPGEVEILDRDELESACIMRRG